MGKLSWLMVIIKLLFGVFRYCIMQLGGYMIRFLSLCVTSSVPNSIVNSPSNSLFQLEIISLFIYLLHICYSNLHLRKKTWFAVISFSDNPCCGGLWNIFSLKWMLSFVSSKVRCLRLVSFVCQVLHVFWSYWPNPCIFCRRICCFSDCV